MPRMHVLKVFGGEGGPSVKFGRRVTFVDAREESID
ncbi:MAG: hypothetical protein QOI57_1079 [Rubrobacteraceae bacterium]|jgi:hypothetical protein|nr:hypothetical protein [Rubrobacteraceae bacterium]